MENNNLFFFYVVAQYKYVSSSLMHGLLSMSAWHSTILPTTLLRSLSGPGGDEADRDVGCVESSYGRVGFGESVLVKDEFGSVVEHTNIS